MSDAESLSQTVAAQRLGITTRQLRGLSNSGKVSRNPDKSYPWPKILHEHREVRAKADRRRMVPEAGSPLDIARTRKMQAQADMAELDLFEREGELMTVTDSTFQLRQALERVNAALRNAPARHAPTLASAAKVRASVAQRILADVIEEIRADLHALGEDYERRSA